MLNPTQRALLETLLTMASTDCHADVVNLADTLGLSCTATADHLQALDEMGMVNAETVRLTMSGLVMAASSRRGRRANQEPSTRARSARRSAERAA